jgi:hypothetical protein
VTLFAPLFFVMIEKTFGKRNKKHQTQGAEERSSGSH